MRMEESRGKKHILVPFDRADASGNFSLNSLTEGRYDVIARAITSSFFYSCGVRCDVLMSLVLGASSVDRQKKTVRIDGQKVRHLRPDERTVCSMLQRVLGGSSPEKQNAAQKQEHRRVPNMTKNKDATDRCLAGWSAHPRGFEEELRAVVTDLVQDFYKLADERTAINTCEELRPDALALSQESLSVSVPNPTSVPSLSTQSELPVCVLYLMEDGQPLHSLLSHLQARDSCINSSSSSSSSAHPTMVVTERTNFLIILGDDRGLSEDQERELYRVLFGSDRSSHLDVNVAPASVPEGEVHELPIDQQTSNVRTDTTACSEMKDGPTCYPGVSFYRCCIGKRPLLASQCILLTLHIIESIISK